MDPTLNGERLEALRNQPIAATEKGFAAIPSRQLVTAASFQNEPEPAFGGAFTTPLLLLRDSALANNVAAMADWCAAAGVLLAPHGKTTMAPQLFARQLAAGAWGITAATIGQVRVYREFGLNRILIANELTDRAGIAWLAAELTADPDWECIAYVDSRAGVALLDEALTSAGAARPLPVLVEFGSPGGRTGCRTVEEGLDVAAAVSQAKALVLAGTAGYEGGLGHDSSEESLQAVASWCQQLRDLSDRLAPTVPEPLEPIVSAGGSAYFDVIAKELTVSSEAKVVLRSGCYLTHDHGLYTEIGPGARHLGPDLIPAIELWAPVLSCPEPGLALACAGRRDVAFDHKMPMPLWLRRQDGAVEPAGGLSVTMMADQHAFMQVPDGLTLALGDLIGCGISHPCTTLDKWRVIPVVDDDYQVIDVVHTFF